MAPTGGPICQYSICFFLLASTACTALRIILPFGSYANFNKKHFFLQISENNKLNFAYNGGEVKCYIGHQCKFSKTGVTNFRLNYLSMQQIS